MSLVSFVRVKGIKRFMDPSGKMRTYHRKTGKPLLAPFGSAEFFLELAALDRETEQPESSPGARRSTRQK
jgi:hypothetical protein